MGVSVGLIAKGAAGLAVAASSVTAGVIYRDNIAYYFKGEIGRVNWYLASLNLPETCRFNETTTETKKECDITKEELKKINFSNRREGDLTVDETFSNMKLEIKRIGKEDRSRYEFYDDLKFTFKGFTANVTVKNGTDDENINLIKNTNPEFKINDSGKLEKAWTADKLAEEVGLRCLSDNECEVSVMVSLDKGNEKITGLSLGDSDSQNKKFTLTKDQEGYNQGFKLTVSSGDITLSKSTSGTETLTNNSNYEVKFTENRWYLTKKTTST